jgi:hypothetical protein
MKRFEIKQHPGDGNWDVFENTAEGKTPCGGNFETKKQAKDYLGDLGYDLDEETISVPVDVNESGR